ncbi:fatty acid-binding protein, liver-like isoform X1 [Denticeps clupeoides]|uniref:fatty acid-binding protein, liver-like isoform X1 n=1 Tax=Denticeps clupeoides TaxID=299321 RepID=UPI0010A46493|nr:fatty acid-binding protein, liver-like isoform X1 [Denticeps clupeoides]XP_028842297.1 fatty acid-binding protein, liver-like isoform X1 [Denticeps clupeoides]
MATGKLNAGERRRARPPDTSKPERSTLGDSAVEQRTMAFDGSWQMYTQENQEEFFRAVSVPDAVIRMIRDVKPVTVIQQKGDDIKVTMKTPIRSQTNTLTLGKEVQVTTMEGKKVKVGPEKFPVRRHSNDAKFNHKTSAVVVTLPHPQCTSRMEEGKMICETEKFTHTREILGDEMVETLTAGSVTLTRRSRRILWIRKHVEFQAHRYNRG